VLGQALVAPDAASPRASGTLASHYAPGVPVLLLQRAPLRRRLHEQYARAAAASTARGAGPSLVGVYSYSNPGLSPGWLHRAMPGDAAAAAHELFAVLRELDAAGVAAIWVEQPPAGAAWDGARDRLQRAAA
jgi:L-threonylcarbamoyladenylate synthase